MKVLEMKNIKETKTQLTKNSMMSLSPDPTITWLTLPAAKALILSDEIEAANNELPFKIERPKLSSPF